MIKNKIIILFLALFLLATFSYADTTQIYTPYVVYAEILNGSQFIAVDNASLTITMPNGTDLVTSIPMTSIGTGKFNYNFTPDMLGIWILGVQYELNGSIIGSVSDQLNVLQSYTGGTGGITYNASLTPNVCVTNSGGMSMLYLFIGIAIIMFIIGLLFQKGIIVILSGIALLLTSFFLFPCSLWFGIIMTGIGLFVIIIGLFTQGI